MQLYDKVEMRQFNELNASEQNAVVPLCSCCGPASGPVLTQAAELHAQAATCPPYSAHQMVNRGALAGMEGMEQLSRQEMLGMLKFGCDRIFQVRWAGVERAGVCCRWLAGWHGIRAPLPLDSPGRSLG